MCTIINFFFIVYDNSHQTHTTMYVHTIIIFFVTNHVDCILLYQIILLYCIQLFHEN